MRRPNASKPTVSPATAYLATEAADGHEAYAVVLTARDGDKVRAALAVTTDPGAALDEARAAAKSFTGDADRSPPGENAIEQIAK